MITLLPALKNHLALPAQTTCTIWLVKQASGNVLGFTDLDQSIAFSLENYLSSVGITIPEVVGTGVVTYQAAAAYSRSDIGTGSDLSPDDIELDGIIESPDITEADLYAGLWDFAFVCVALINWADAFQPIPVTTLTQAGGSALCTLAYPPPTPMTQGDIMLVSGASPGGYDGAVAITSVPASNKFHYNVSGALSSPATGTISVNTQMGALVLRAGNIGEVTLERNAFKATQSGRTQYYSRVIGELTQPGCRAELGDTRCKVALSPPAWAPGMPYSKVSAYDASVGSTVSPLTYNGRDFVCTTPGTSGGSEPAWNTTVGGTTTDNTVVWTCIYGRTVTGTITGVNSNLITVYDSSRTEPGPPTYATISAISNGNPGIVTCSPVANLFNGEAVTLSGIVGPALLNTDTVIRGLFSGGFSLGIDTSNTGIYPPYISGGVVTPLGATSGYFDFGVLTFTSGNNSGLAREVRGYVPGQITFDVPFPYTVQIGDTYTLTAGCDKSLATCQTKFSNVLNFRGEPYLPGLDKIIQVGKQS